MRGTQTHLFAFKLKLFYWVCSYIITCFLCFFCREQLFSKLAADFIKKESILIFTNVTEAFWGYLQLAIIVAGILNIPLALYLFILYTIKGLYDYKNKLQFCRVVVIFVIILNFNYILLIKIWPNILAFFYEFAGNNESFTLRLMPKFMEYLTLFQKLVINTNIIIFIVIATAFVLALLNKYKSFRKKIYFLFLVIFSTLAPPDILVQVISFQILLVIYEFILYLFSWINQINKLIDGGGIRTHDEN